MGHNLAPLKDNCALFAPTPYFQPWDIRRCHLNFSPGNPCCHGNEIWDKIEYNSVRVRDICKIFASIRRFSEIGHWMLPTEFFPKRLLLPWQQNLGHNGLDLDLCKRYIEDLCVRWGVFKVDLFWYGQCACAIIRKYTYAPCKNHTLNIQKIVIIYRHKTFLHFLTLL